MLRHISALGDQKVHVVNKTVAQQTDFAAQHVAGGIVTAGRSGKLLQLLFLCFGVNRTICVGKVLKLLFAIMGSAVAVWLPFLGVAAHLPSALIAFYQIFWLFAVVLYVKCRIRIPKSPEGKQNESSTDLRNTQIGN
jgi:hypothetical protein